MGGSSGSAEYRVLPVLRVSLEIEATETQCSLTAGIDCFSASLLLGRDNCDYTLFLSQFYLSVLGRYLADSHL